jgi:hypothetical protein
VIQHLPCKCEALGSNLSTAKKIKKIGKGRGCDSEVQSMVSMHGALSVIPTTGKKKVKQDERLTAVAEMFLG